MADINDIIHRFNNGGTLTLNFGSALVVRNYVHGSLKVKPSFRLAIERHEGQSPTVPHKGDYTYGEIEFQVYGGSMDTGLFELNTSVEVAANDTVKTGTITVLVRDADAAATGDKLETTDAFFAEAPQWENGGMGEHDKLTLKFKCVTGPTCTAV